MTQVIKVLPVWNDRTVVTKQKKPRKGFSDLHKGKGRLSESDIRAIRLAGEWRWPIKVVAKAFSLHYNYASLVMKGDTHPHVR